MRIDPNVSAQITQQNKAAEKVAKRAQESIREDGGGATLSLNAAAATLSTSSSTPEIRQERVQALKAAVDNNNYRPEPEKIADSMLSSLTNWRF